MDWIYVDGGYGEGGGQIIRTALSLSALTGQPVEFYNVRANRGKPGLQPQHLTAVKAAAALCDARTQGDSVGSVGFRFQPQAPVRPGEYGFDIGTAGAATLVAQTLLIPLVHAERPSRLALTGGTHVPHSPPEEYLETIYSAILRRAGADVRIRYEEAGFYPKGGGRIEASIQPAAELNPIDWTERGKLRSLTAYVVTSSLPPHVAERGEKTILQWMKSVGRQARIVRRDLPSRGPGAAVTLVAECEGGWGGFSGIGERGKPMEQVAEEPCEAFMNWWKSGATCDERLADQLVLPMALSPGVSRWSSPRLTQHLRTVFWLARQFLPIEYAFAEEDGRTRVTMKGCALR
jgi:RNA 3'-terminal phosphate cyclase (ATP)